MSVPDIKFARLPSRQGRRKVGSCWWGGVAPRRPVTRVLWRHACGSRGRWV